MILSISIIFSGVKAFHPAPAGVLDRTDPGKDPLRPRVVSTPESLFAAGVLFLIDISAKYPVDLNSWITRFE